MPLGAQGLLAPAPVGGPPDRAAGTTRGLLIIGRLRPGLTTGAADAALRTVSALLARSQPPEDAGHVLSVHSLARGQLSDRPTDDSELALPLGALTGAALILLVIASLNVANVQLARTTSRRKEIAMRLALGAGRGRIVAQLMTEGLVIALAGGLLGLALSVWVLHAALASLRPIVEQSLAADITPDWRVWLTSLACAMLAALAVAVGPAWRMSRLDLLPGIKGWEGGGAGRGRLGGRNLLVAAQVSLSLALLAASGLFVRAAVAADLADPGYRYDRQLLVRVDPTLAGYDEESGRQAYRRLMDRLRSTPGVESAALASLVAFSNDSSSRRLARAAARFGPDNAGGFEAQSYAIGAWYFRTLGLSMLRGREFLPAEELDSPTSPVVIIDEPLAAALFPGQDPLGQRIRFVTAVAGGSPPPDAGLEVVGVAPGLRHRITDPGPVPHVYLPLGSHYSPLLNIHVRAAGHGAVPPDEVRRALSTAIQATDSRLAAIGGVQTLVEARDGMPLNWIVRSAAKTFGACGAIALLMAAVGLYGVKAYLVARRTREIGVRLALGASASEVIRLVLREGAVLLGGSVVVGFALALIAGRAVASLLVGVRPIDPLVLSASALVLAAAFLAACYLPARRATRVSPLTALRVE